MSLPGPREVNVVLEKICKSFSLPMIAKMMR